MLTAALAEQQEKDIAHWGGVVEALNTLHKKVQKKPKDLRRMVSINPGSILNGYREGDLSFAQAVRLLKKWKRAR